MENKNNNSDREVRQGGWFDQSLEFKSIERVSDNPQEHV